MNKIILSQRVLRYVYGLVVLIIGIDKLLRTDIIVNWDIYLPTGLLNIVPISSGALLIGVALIEIVVGLGLLFLNRYTRILAYVSAAWLLLISVNLLMIGFIDIAARDIVLAVGALVLAWLTEAQTSTSGDVRH